LGDFEAVASPTHHKTVILSGAQDDGFVGGLTKNIQNKLAPMEGAALG
jgi:hypothetical protein